MRRISLFSVLAALVGLLLPRARGHSDPWGDIHPKVTVLEGNFSIVFNSQVPESSSNYNAERAVFRTIYSPEGKLVAPRHALDRKRSHAENGPVGLYGGGVFLGNATLIFQGDRSGKPGYLLRTAEGKTMPVSLPWPKEISLSLFEAVEVTPDGIGITGKEDRDDLKFYWFPFGSKNAPTILNLGPTECIYDFPMASNPVFAGGKFHVAFMRGGAESVKLYLWSWKPGDKQGKEVTLDSPGYGNSDLSMAAIGDQLCLAYHCQMFEGSADPLAKIVTVFRKAE